MKVWAVANQKGGVGKTTTAITIGGTLSMRGKRVLLVDLDPHGSMTSYFGHDPDDEGASRNTSSTMNSYKSGGTPWYILIDQEGLVVFNDFHLDVDKTIAYLKTID